MNRLDRLRSAEQETWERYYNLGQQRWGTDSPRPELVDAHNAAERKWSRANQLLSFRNQNIGAHADLLREVDEPGVAKTEFDHPHVIQGRSCIRECGAKYWWVDGESIKVWSAS